LPIDFLPSACQEVELLFTDIILIGPIGAGKSTQGKLLSEKLGLPQCSMDTVRWDYYKEIGYSEETARQLGEQEGFAGVYRYWKPFEAHAVERLLAEHHNCVIDFGAGHSVYEDDALFSRVQQVLAPYKNVVLLLPSPDLDESIRLLHTRTYAPLPEEFDLHAHFVKHHSNHDLAKIVVYTEGKTPEQTRDEILAAVGENTGLTESEEP
jgi:shikimate kinase